MPKRRGGQGFECRKRTGAAREREGSRRVALLIGMD